MWRGIVVPQTGIGSRLPRDRSRGVPPPTELPDCAGFFLLSSTPNTRTPRKDGTPPRGRLSIGIFFPWHVVICTIERMVDSSVKIPPEALTTGCQRAGEVPG